MHEYDAVLFDSDGVLVEPPPRERQAQATRAAFRAVGVDDPDQRHVDAIGDGVTVDGLADICAAYGIDRERFWAARERHDERVQLVDFEDGSRTRYDDVDAISDLELSCGVVSNNHHSTIAFVLEYFDLTAVFDTYCGREMTVESLTRKKPNTYYLDRALADLTAASALYVGDSESDVVAADRAGLDSVFVRRPHCAEVSLSVEPTHVVEGLDELSALV